MKTIFFCFFYKLKESNSLSLLVDRFQDERYFILFSILGKEQGTIRINSRYISLLGIDLKKKSILYFIILLYRFQIKNFNYSKETETVFSRTDKAIEELHPWRSDIKLKVFSSRIM